MLLNRLHKCAVGEIEMSAESLKAATFLFERVVPRAEAPRDVNLKVDTTLSELIGAVQQPEQPRLDS